MTREVSWKISGWRVSQLSCLPGYKFDCLDDLGKKKKKTDVGQPARIYSLFNSLSATNSSHIKLHITTLQSLGDDQFFAIMFMFMFCFF